MSSKMFKIICLFVIILVISIGVFQVIRQNSEKMITENIIEITGIVDEITATSITVIPNKENDLSVSEKIVVNTSKLEFHKGDNVTIFCQADKESSLGIKIISILKNDYSKVVKLYLTAIDNLMNEDKGLNENIEYLVVDTKSFVNLSNQNLLDEEEDKILQYCSKYNDDIREESLDEPNEKIVDNKITSFKGMIIYVQNVDKLSENEVKFTIVKYVGVDGALFANYTLKYNGTEWNITEKTYNIS